MMTWIRQLFGDPNGDGHEAVEAFKKQRDRAGRVGSDMNHVAESLARSREAVKAKAYAIQQEGEDRVSQTELRAAQEIV